MEEEYHRLVNGFVESLPRKTKFWWHENVSIGRFQAIAFKLSTLAAQIEVASSFLYRVACLYDHGSEYRKEAAIVKVFCSELAIKAAEEAMRIHAGAGYIRESLVERYFRDAMLGYTTEGTTEIQQIAIARQLRLFR